MTESLSDKYTSLLGMVDADSSDSFIHFLERVVARLKGWNENLLAIGGGDLAESGHSINFGLYYGRVQDSIESIKAITYDMAAS